MKKLTKCKCPRCGKIYTESLFVYDSDSKKLFYKYCSECNSFLRNVVDISSAYSCILPTSKKYKER